MGVKRASGEQSWDPVRQDEVADLNAEIPYARSAPRSHPLRRRRWRTWAAAALAGGSALAALALWGRRCGARGGPAAGVPDGAVGLAAAAADPASRADALVELLRRKRPEESQPLVLQAMERSAERQMAKKEAEAFALDRELLAKPGALASKILSLAKSPGVLELAKKKDPALKEALEANKTLSREAEKARKFGEKDEEAYEAARTVDERNAECSINMLFVAQYLARGGATIDSLVATCGNPKKGLPGKICILNSVVFVGTLARLGTNLALAASNCGPELNIKSTCAASAVAIVASLSQFPAAGMVIKKACNSSKKSAGPQARADLIGPDNGRQVAAVAAGQRRLAEGRRLFLGAGPENLLAGCVLDATAITFAFGSIGLSISDAVLDNCPPSRFPNLTDFQFKQVQNACTLDISVVLFQVTRIIAFVSLAILQCHDIGDLQAFCSLSISSIIAAVAGLNIIANGLYGSCHLGLWAEGMEPEPSSQPLPPRAQGGVEVALGLSAPERRLAGTAANLKARLELAQKFGYNASDPHHVPRFESAEKAMEALRAFQDIEAEDFARDTEAMQQRFKEPKELLKRLSGTLGIHKSTPSAEPSAERQREEDRQFLELMEPVMSEEDLRHIDKEAMPAHTQGLFERLRSSDQCV